MIIIPDHQWYYHSYNRTFLYYSLSKSLCAGYLGWLSYSIILLRLKIGVESERKQNWPQLLHVPSVRSVPRAILMHGQEWRGFVIEGLLSEIRHVTAVVLRNGDENLMPILGNMGSPNSSISKWTDGEWERKTNSLFNGASISVLIQLAICEPSCIWIWLWLVTVLAIGLTSIRA